MGCCAVGGGFILLKKWKNSEARVLEFVLFYIINYVLNTHEAVYYQKSFYIHMFLGIFFVCRKNVILRGRGRPCVDYSRFVLVNKFGLFIFLFLPSLPLSALPLPLFLFLLRRARTPFSLFLFSFFLSRCFSCDAKSVFPSSTARCLGASRVWTVPFQVFWVYFLSEYIHLVKFYSIHFYIKICFFV